MSQDDLLAEQFEQRRLHLRGVGYRMLRSVGEADDAVQEAWLRLSRSDADEIENLRVADDRRRAREPERVQGEAPTPSDDLAKQRVVVDAFFAAARDGDFEGLVALLHPDAVLRADGGALRPTHSVVRHGADEIARNAMQFSHLSAHVRPV